VGLLKINLIIKSKFSFPAIQFRSNSRTKAVTLIGGYNEITTIFLLDAIPECQPSLLVLKQTEETVKVAPF